jgi:23S rRNA (guanosine2251-2'-O)-methyltransferase
MRVMQSASPGEVIFGIHAVRHALLKTPEDCRELWINEGRLKGPGFAEIIQLATRAGLRISRMPVERLDRMSKGAVHQGVILERRLSSRPPMDLETILGTQASPATLLLILDGVQDPQNLGACLRTANAAGAFAVITPKHETARLTDTVRKVACGAAELTPVITVTNLARCLEGLKQKGVWIIGTDAAAGQSLYDTDLTVPLALVLGSEGSGLRQNTKQHCDSLIRLPMFGAVESLNVSVTAGVCL